MRRRISRATYEEEKAAAIKVVEQAAALEEAAKGTQEEWEKALDLFGEYLTGEQEEPKRQKVREPYTREELEAVYDRKIEAEVRHWGEHSFWANMAREVKAKRLEEFDAGKVVGVYSSEYHADGMDWADNYYSDGTTDKSCYGYSD